MVVFIPNTFMYYIKKFRIFATHIVSIFENQLMTMDRIMYHTQQDRGYILEGPCLCSRKDAWLGTAYYFWGDEIDAIRWGYDSKNNKFQIYNARIISENVLDTVYNEEHYDFFIKSLQKVVDKCIKLTGRKPCIEHLCEYFNERANWKKEIDVILISDNPSGSRETLPIPIRRRIQAAVYNEQCIHDFNLKVSYG